MRMIRKQVYIEAAQEAKLRRLAAARRCTEAAIVREAIDELAETEDPVVAALRAKGLIMESDEPRVSDEELGRLERQWADIAAQIGDIRLGEAVIQDREERDAFLAGHLGDHEEVHPRKRLRRAAPDPRRA